MINHPNRRKKVAATASASPASAARPKRVARVVHDHEAEYPLFEAAVRASFQANVAGASRLFCTDVADMFDLFLSTLPASERPVHNCHACRRFVERFGGIVSIADDGEVRPVMWTPAADLPDYYGEVNHALHERARKARVTGVFLTKEPTWGTPRTGSWTHLSVTPPAALVYHERALTAGQAMAAARENYRTVATALTEFSAPMLDEALRILEAEALSRSEKFVGPVKWLRALHDRPKGKRGENVLWKAIATAPEGYCHPRASVVGSLLEDIAAGMAFADIKARFNAKVAPLAYQRPQAPPAAGNIKAAEALFDKLGLAPSLERRFARVEELQSVWLPKVAAQKPSGGSVFGHLTPKAGGGAVRPVDLPSATMTWAKFSQTVMPNAEQMELMVPSHGAFIALTTAVNSDATPILKWDRDEERNPVAWYVYPGGSAAHSWGLSATWAKVTAVAPLPPLWGSRPSPYLGEGMVLVLDGARDLRDAGNALFPECLKDDLHGARSTIEAYSRSAKLSGREEASACGYDIRKGQKSGVTLRAFVNGAWSVYTVDRWD